MKNKAPWFVTGMVVLAAAVVLSLGANGDGERLEYTTVNVECPAKPSFPNGAPAVPQINEFKGLLDRQLRTLAQGGYEVVEIVPLIRGHYLYNTGIPRNETTSSCAFGYGMGYSYTGGVTIVAVKRG